MVISMEFIDKSINDQLNSELEATESRSFIKSQRALFGDPSGKIKTFAIISPENLVALLPKEGEDPNQLILEYMENPVAYNKKKLKELKDLLYNGSDEDRLAVKKKIEDQMVSTGNTALRIGGFDYVRISGKYGKTEHSFMIFNCTLEDAVYIARAYGQESFFFGIVSSNPSIEPSKIAYYKTSNHCKTYKLVEITKTVSNESEASDFFSKYGAKFRINMEEFGDRVSPVLNEGRFKDSFESVRTFMSRASARRDSRKG